MVRRFIYVLVGFRFGKGGLRAVVCFVGLFFWAGEGSFFVGCEVVIL